MNDAIEPRLFLTVEELAGFALAIRRSSAGGWTVVYTATDVTGAEVGEKGFHSGLSNGECLDLVCTVFDTKLFPPTPPRAS